MSDPVLFELTCGKLRLIFSDKDEAIETLKTWVVRYETLDVHLNKMSDGAIVRVCSGADYFTRNLTMLAPFFAQNYVCDGCDAHIKNVFPDQFTQLRNRHYVLNATTWTIVRGQCPMCKEFDVRLGEVVEPPLDRVSIHPENTQDESLLPDDPSYEAPIKKKRERKRRRKRKQK
jgi:hypothetical protein